VRTNLECLLFSILPNCTVTHAYGLCADFFIFLFYLSSRFYGRINGGKNNVCSSVAVFVHFVNLLYTAKTRRYIKKNYEFWGKKAMTAVRKKYQLTTKKVWFTLFIMNMLTVLLLPLLLILCLICFVLIFDFSSWSDWLLLTFLATCHGTFTWQNLLNSYSSFTTNFCYKKVITMVWDI